MPDPVAVVLLTQDHCASCDEAKDVLDRVAHDFCLTIATGDLNSERGQRLALEGAVMFPPGLFLDGKAFSYGRLSERKLRRELARRGVEAH